MYLVIQCLCFLSLSLSLPFSFAPIVATVVTLAQNHTLKRCLCVPLSKGYTFFPLFLIVSVSGSILSSLLHHPLFFLPSSCPFVFFFSHSQCNFLFTDTRVNLYSYSILFLSLLSLSPSLSCQWSSSTDLCVFLEATFFLSSCLYSHSSCFTCCCLLLDSTIVILLSFFFSSLLVAPGAPDLSTLLPCFLSIWATCDCISITTVKLMKTIDWVNG